MYYKEMHTASNRMLIVTAGAQHTATNSIKDFGYKPAYGLCVQNMQTYAKSLVTGVIYNDGNVL
jgi:hypothetical protein